MGEISEEEVKIWWNQIAKDDDLNAWWSGAIQRTLWDDLWDDARRGVREIYVVAIKTRQMDGE